MNSADNLLPEHGFPRRLERIGQQLRGRLGLAPADHLDPTALIATFKDILSLDLLALFSESHPDVQSLQPHSRSWSAMAYREPPGPWLVVSNPWHSETRRRVSTMEEVAHIYLAHKPTMLVACPLTGLPRRTYAAAKEKEAYGVAGAALVPFGGLVSMLRAGATAFDVATAYGVSQELATMRIQVTRARSAA